MLRIEGITKEAWEVPLSIPHLLGAEAAFEHKDAGDPYPEFALSSSPQHPENQPYRPHAYERVCTHSHTPLLYASCTDTVNIPAHTKSHGVCTRQTPRVFASAKLF